MTNKQLNKAARHYADFHGAKLVRRVPVLINGVRHHRITLRYNMAGIVAEKDFQVSEEQLSKYE